MNAVEAAALALAVLALLGGVYALWIAVRIPRSVRQTRTKF
ncbi:threonine/homoserine/homoserine lactone efflux protein [Kitasatospora gansuensis]|uniref:Threonine/homoserine/homoserine lactone efflux protein n=1 Tax=Kitasatospora gansuensis TaxID=258050 RepID=A0A7W7SHR7_9ACTN|nr:hypothetical protein [Kitasatospora gansuensis]MBB4949541.1 threonine/homoserine/homoserine lactone efflux protein [Kitasatospora gansuensis]